MKIGYTDITVILDRSGSMRGKEKFVEEGFDEFVNEQKQQEGTTLLSAVQFDTKYEQMFEAVNINTNPKVKLEARGMTALYDAIGKTINETGQRLSGLKKSKRPENVIFLIITDGQENSSKEFNASQIKEMIKHQEDKYSWQFIYLGSNQDAVVEAKKFGISLDKAATYSDTEGGLKSAIRSCSVMTNSYRSTKIMGFTESQREDLIDSTK